MLTTLITILYVIACVFLILVVLLQAGKGGGMGAAFGGGATQTVFGGRGAAPFLVKITTGAAVVFLLGALWLSYISSHVKSVVKTAAEENELKTPEVEITVPDAGIKEKDGGIAGDIQP